MILRDIIGYLDEIAPEDLQEDWDNSGLQLGDRGKLINRVLLALDLDNEVLKYAIKKDVDLVITHHPLIFSGIKSIDRDDYKGSIIFSLIENNIGVYSSHTNLDKVSFGVSNSLGEFLGLRKMDYLTKEGEFDQYGYGRVGYVDKILLGDFLTDLKSKGLDYIQLYGDRNTYIEKIALVGGSGSDFISDAYKSKADVFISGDIKYHEAQVAMEKNFPIVDIGHHGSEKFILETLQKKLEAKFPKLDLEIWPEPSPRYEIFW